MVSVEIPVGKTHAEQVVVGEDNVASAVGSGLVDVFATPMMVALMEQAAAACVQPALEAGQATVGTAVDVRHTAATPVGMKVWATATLTAAEGRVYTFRVEARDEAGPIGAGTHTRAVVDVERFCARARARQPG